MKVLIWHLDGMLPNLALMRIAAHEDRDHRRRLIREFGARPYPMPFRRTPELVGFQRWVIGAYDKRISWAAWHAAGYEPRRLGDRGSLPLANVGEP